jgi:hypothetical protein
MNQSTTELCFSGFFVACCGKKGNCKIDSFLCVALGLVVVLTEDPELSRET